MRTMINAYAVFRRLNRERIKLEDKCDKDIYLMGKHDGIAYAMMIIKEMKDAKENDSSGIV